MNFSDYIESWAKHLHESYRKARPAEGISVPAWEELSDEVKERNRAQIRETPRRLRLIGCKLAEIGGCFVIVDESGSAVTEFTSEQIEIMAKDAHQCWMRHTSGQAHPCMMAYDELPEVEKEKDRVVVRTLIAYISM